MLENIKYQADLMLMFWSRSVVSLYLYNKQNMFFPYKTKLKLSYLLKLFYKSYYGFHEIYSCLLQFLIYPFAMIKSDSSVHLHSIYFVLPKFITVTVLTPPPPPPPQKKKDCCSPQIFASDSVDRIERLEIFDEFEEWYMMQVSFYYSSAFDCKIYSVCLHSIPA